MKLKIINILCILSVIIIGSKVKSENLFDIDGGSRISALSGSGISVTKTVEAIFYNPAGINDIDAFEIDINYLRWIGELNKFNISAVLPVGNIGVFGAAISYLLYGDMPIVTLDSSMELVESDNSASANDFAITVSYARLINNFISAGVNLKIISLSLENENSTDMGGDIGLIGYFLDKKLIIGVSMRNIDTGYNFMKDKFNSPIKFVLGLHYNINTIITDFNLVPLLDIIKSSNDISINSGLEIVYNNFASLRIGYKINNDITNLTYGIGVQYNKNKYSIAINYALIPTEYFGITHNIGLTFHL